MSALWNTEDPGALTIDGKRLEYRCIGPAPQDAPTLVLLHEGLGCVALWRDFPDIVNEVLEDARQQPVPLGHYFERVILTLLCE